ncbi:radical SAM protein [Kineosporia sp. NBRC 101731]|uniref:radical SAM protein n=1 Tax=Kineosporia sp. NBRC 101731 TaxID=3032199 RepID=UPI0024A4A6B6|nr:radical SAM protein [Kineosporia sp. NBRC 101731]GLY29783.1 hypothetical protein Kisp02_31480 [Kineosporia sp. NBRC 101731]
MIGTRLDETDSPRLVRSDRGWWFIGNQTWTLLRHDQVGPDGTINPETEGFLREAGAYRPRVPRSYMITVLTSTVCNLGCGYCFQNTGAGDGNPFRPDRITRKRLTSPMIDKIIDFTRERMDAAGLDRLYLLLFGGEPLLNPKGCLELLTRTGEIGRGYANMATNGVLLNRKLAIDLEAAGLCGAQITLDGSRADHDSVRVKHSGAGTFDAIVKNVARATEATDLRWNLRVNVSHHNAERIGELFGQLDGAIDPARSTMTFAWVGDSGVGYANDLRHQDSVADRFLDWSIQALEAGYRIARPTMRTTCQTCSDPGGRHGAVINADGTLYSSWQSAGKEGWQVGTVDSGYLDVDRVRNRWVTCGYEYQQADGTQVARFQDSVDGRLLDYLLASDRL